MAIQLATRVTSLAGIKNVAPGAYVVPLSLQYANKNETPDSSGRLNPLLEAKANVEPSAFPVCVGTVPVPFVPAV